MAFRIFFLLAGLSAVSLIPVWLAALSGYSLPGVDLFWHAHEMIFGFVGAVLAGFFLTAVPKWTKSRVLSGAPLVGLAVLWGVGRVIRATFTGPLVALDALFLFVLAAAIAVPIVRSRSVRNALFPVLLLVMGGADVIGHLAPELMTVALRAAVLSAVAVVVIFGGRITPLFSRNALRLPIRERSRIDDAAIGCVLALIPLSLFPEQTALTVIFAGAGAILNLLRMRGWRTREALARPLLAVLHAGYLWVAVSMALWALAAIRPDILATSTALHASTVGVLGTYTLGMMSRVSLGHTGRPLVAAAPMKVAFAAMVLAGVVRVAIPGSIGALHASGSLWTLAALLFLWVYTPILLRPRADSAPG